MVAGGRRHREGDVGSRGHGLHRRRRDRAVGTRGRRDREVADGVSCERNRDGAVRDYVRERVRGRGRDRRPVDQEGRDVVAGGWRHREGNVGSGGWGPHRRRRDRAVGARGRRDGIGDRRRRAVAPYLARTGGMPGQRPYRTQGAHSVVAVIARGRRELECRNRRMARRTCHPPGLVSRVHLGVRQGMASGRTVGRGRCRECHRRRSEREHEHECQRKNYQSLLHMLIDVLSLQTASP